jgi:hypothetical protein
LPAVDQPAAGDFAEAVRFRRMAQGHRNRDRRLANGRIHRAEMQWYDTHGIGKVGMTVKRLLD